MFILRFKEALERKKRSECGEVERLIVLTGCVVGPLVPWSRQIGTDSCTFSLVQYILIRLFRGIHILNVKLSSLAGIWLVPHDGVLSMMPATE